MWGVTGSCSRAQWRDFLGKADGAGFCVWSESGLRILPGQLRCWWRMALPDTAAPPGLSMAIGMGCLVNYKTRLKGAVAF